VGFPISELVEDAKGFEPADLRREEIESSFIVNNWVDPELFRQQRCVVGGED
jgi:hypothetical protein